MISSKANAASKSQPIPKPGTLRSAPTASLSQVVYHACNTKRHRARTLNATVTHFMKENTLHQREREADGEREGSWQTPAARARARASTARNAARGARPAAAERRGRPAAPRLLAP